MIIRHEPKAFGIEYVRMKGTDQYPMFAAVALGIKSSYDDWIDVKHFLEFKQVCSKYGLFVEADVIFKTGTGQKNSIIGGKNITTTFQEGFRIGESDVGTVHVIVSKSKETALEAKKFGWYSVVINNRSFNKPFVDHLRYGRLLGFPACCVDFFRLYNNWAFYSHPYETFKNTPPGPGSYHCNNILMDNTSFLIHHLPCSYQCKATIEYSTRLEKALRELEPEWVEKTVELLKKPVLVFGEKNFIVFDGKMSGCSIEYTDCLYFDNPARIEEKVAFFDKIKGGTRITVDKNITIEGSDGTISVPKKESWFMVGFQ